MITLSSVSPGFASEVDAALASKGRQDLATKLASAAIERCTYDPDVEAGYVYMALPRSPAVADGHGAPVAETIDLLELGFNVDVDHDGNVFGIELLSRPDVIAGLRAARIL